MVVSGGGGNSVGDGGGRNINEISRIRGSNSNQGRVPGDSDVGGGIFGDGNGEIRGHNFEGERRYRRSERC